MKDDEVDQTAGRGRSGRRRKIPQRFRDIPLNQKQLATSRNRSVSVSSTTSSVGSKRKGCKCSNHSFGSAANENSDGTDDQDEECNSSDDDTSTKDLEMSQNLLEGAEDTLLSSGSHVACLHAAGGCRAIDRVMVPASIRTTRNAFAW